MWQKEGQIDDSWSPKIAGFPAACSEDRSKYSGADFAVQDTNISINGVVREVQQGFRV